MIYGRPVRNFAFVIVTVSINGSQKRMRLTGGKRKGL